MIKKDVTYNDLDGNSVTKTFHFNLSKAELTEMAITGQGGGLADEIRAIQNTADIKLVLKSFKEIMTASVGRREGDRFIKDDDARSALMDTEAYGELFMELITDSAKAVEFIKGIIPQGVLEMVDKKITDEGLVVEGWTPNVRKVETVDVDLAVPADAVVSVTTDLTGNIIASVEQGDMVKKDITMYTRKQLLEMPKDEFYEVAGRDPEEWSKAVLSIAMARRAADKQ